MGVTTPQPRRVGGRQPGGGIQASWGVLVLVVAAAAVVAYALTRPPSFATQTKNMTDTANDYVRHVRGKGGPDETDCTVLQSYHAALTAMTQDSTRSLPAATISNARAAKKAVETQLANC